MKQKKRNMEEEKDKEIIIIIKTEWLIGVNDKSKV